MHADDVGARGTARPASAPDPIATVRSACSIPSSRASSSVIGRSSPSKRRLQTTHVHARIRPRAGSSPGRCCRRRAGRASARRAPAPSSIPSCSSCPARSSATLSGMRRSSDRISPNGELGDRDGVLAGAVRHVDAARRCGRDVDGVVAGAGAHDQRQPAGVEHRRGHLGARARRARPPPLARSPRVSASSLRSGS